MSAIHWFVSEVDPKNAGYRVRILPLIAELRTQGETIEVHPMAELGQVAREVGAQARAVVLAKPADSLAAMGMAQFNALGVPVIVDLFDNYFSWSAAALQRQISWQWLRTLNSASLLIASSDYLRHVIASLTDKPVLQVSDQVPVPARDRLAPAWLGLKWDQPARIELLWYGIAGNPYYTAGLEDLLRWAGVVRELVGQLAPPDGVRLTICTNRVAAVENALHTMRSNQVDTRYVEWSQAACDDLLDQSHVVLLPTNISGFSLSKTHNRCSDALAHGCLVLGSPQGPYQGLGGAVFDSPQALLQGLHEANAHTVRQRVLQSFEALRARHDAGNEVTRLRQAIDTLISSPRRRIEAATRGVVVATLISPPLLAHAREMGYLMVACMDNPKPEHFDIRFMPMPAVGWSLALKVSELAMAAIEAQLARNVDSDVDIDGGVAEYRIDKWRLQLDRTLMQVAVLQGLPEDLLRQLQVADQLESDRGRACEARVDAMCRLLQRMGFTQLHFAGDETAGWQSYAEQADPALLAKAARLRELWVLFEGREAAWGRPTETAA
jgi:hypothetical protein